MQVKAILVEGKDGNEYLLGIGPRQSGQQEERPTIWRRADGNWVQLPETCEASMTIRDQLVLSGPPLQPGFGHDEHVKWAVLESLSDFTRTFYAGARW